MRQTVFNRGVAQNRQNTCFQYLSGTLEDNFWESEFIVMRRILGGNSGTWRTYWDVEQDYFTEDFKELVSEILEEK